MQIRARITGRCLEYTTSTSGVTILFAPELDRAWWKYEGQLADQLSDEELRYFHITFG